MICSRIVEALSDWWAYIGWGLFLCYFLVPIMVARQDPEGSMLVWLVSGVLLLVWWIIDVVDQQAPAWAILAGLMMLGLGFVPRGIFLTITAWALYWTKVRE
jgi:hypothetical protein